MKIVSVRYKDNPALPPNRCVFRFSDGYTVAFLYQELIPQKKLGFIGQISLWKGVWLVKYNYAYYCRGSHYGLEKYMPELRKRAWFAYDFVQKHLTTTPKGFDKKDELGLAFARDLFKNEPLSEKALPRP